MQQINRRIVFLLCAAAMLAAAHDAAAQAGGRIAGTVKDRAGEPVEGVRVTATSPAMDTFKLENTTDRKGKFLLAFSNSAWPYVVELAKEGYQTVIAPIDPVSGQTRMVEFVLEPATAEDQAAAERAALAGAGRAILVYNEGVEAQRAGDLEQAAAKYGEAAAINPELAAAHTSLAAIAHLQGDYATAAAEAEQALAIDPTDTRAMQLRFDAYRLAGDEAKAAEAAEALKELGGLGETAARIFNEGARAYNEGDVSSAISKFQQAAELDPTLVPARLVLAKIFFAEGNVSEALARAEEVLALEPAHQEALGIVYESALRLNDPEKAAAALDGLAASDPQWAATGLFQIAVELFNSGRNDEAAQALERVLEVEPDHARAHYLLGTALFNTGQTELAADHLRRFVELAPDDPDVAIAEELLAYVK